MNGFKNLKKQDLKIIYKNKLDKACFAHDAAYAYSKDIAKRTVSDRVLKDRAHEIVLNLQYDGCLKRIVK